MLGLFWRVFYLGPNCPKIMDYSKGFWGIFVRVRVRARVRVRVRVERAAGGGKG